jgi:hypothetical protein
MAQASVGNFQNGMSTGKTFLSKMSPTSIFPVDGTINGECFKTGCRWSHLSGVSVKPCRVYIGPIQIGIRRCRADRVGKERGRQKGGEIEEGGGRWLDQG